MIRIPFTTWSVSWHLPAVVLAFTFLADTWWKGLVGALAMFAATWVMLWGVWIVIVLIGDGKKRRPGESLRSLSRRVSADLDKYRAGKQNARLENDLFWGYRYVVLDCGHIAHDRYIDGIPSEGDEFWCWGHRRFGPAQLQTVRSVDYLPPQDHDKALVI